MPPSARKTTVTPTTLRPTGPVSPSRSPRPRPPSPRWPRRPPAQIVVLSAVTSIGAIVRSSARVTVTNAAPAALRIFFFVTPRPPRSTLFPYTTLFRSTYSFFGPSNNNCAPEPTSTQTVTILSDRKSTHLNSSHSSTSYAAFSSKNNSDTNNAQADGTCEPFTISKASPTITTVASPATGTDRRAVGRYLHRRYRQVFRPGYGDQRRSGRPPHFFFRDTPATQIYTLSLHDALPIYLLLLRPQQQQLRAGAHLHPDGDHPVRSEEHTSELQSQFHLVCRLQLEKQQ